jgi:hypothetical protein
MINKIGQDFENQAQRMIYSYIATYPPFYSVESSEANTDQQKSAYEFLLNIYMRLYENPTILGLPLLPDESYNDWELQKEKPNLASKMRSMVKKVDEFINTLHTVFLVGNIARDSLIIKIEDLNLKTTFIKQLNLLLITCEKNNSSYTLTCPNDTLIGMKFLAKLSAENIQKPSFLFSRGIFNQSSAYIIDLFRELSGNVDAYNRLIWFFEKHDYRRVDNRENRVSLDYIKNHSDKDTEIKSNWAERTHSGIEFTFEELRYNQLLIGLRVPYFTDVLKAMDKADEKVKNYVVHQSKRCDNCGYCTQTDKTGTRPKQYIPVQYDGKVYYICPLFCGFMHRWRKLNDEIVNNIIMFLSFVDKVV